MRRHVAVAAVLAGIAVGAIAACDPSHIFGACSDDLFTEVNPPTATIRVGESSMFVANAWGCRGSKRLTDTWRYYVTDTTIARVDSITGRVSGRAVGVTDVGARGAVYHDVNNRSRVTVTP